MENTHFVVAVEGEDGKGHFVEPGDPASLTVEGVVDSTMWWETKETPRLPDGIGGPPATSGFALPGGTKFGLICMPPHSADKMDISSIIGSEHNQGYSDPAMHRSDSIDYEVIISGMIDIELDSGEVRTLGPGSCLVMGGVGHAWRNRYDEPCIYAAVIVGAHGHGDSHKK